MTDGGKLLVRIRHDGHRVSGVEVVSTRPQASRLLNGRTSEQAAQLVPMLFSLCGRAQGAAAQAAIAAAEGRMLAQGEALERAVACEAAQEHAWRLLLDWPPLLDLPPQQADFVRWHAMLREQAAGNDNSSSLQRDIEQHWLGSPVAEWLTLPSQADMQDWWRETDSPAARLLRKLDAADAHMMSPEAIPLLPEFTAQQAWERWGNALNEGFARQPDWQGTPAETGALARYAAMPLFADFLRQRPSRIVARVLGRIRELLETLVEQAGTRIDYAEGGQGAGLAVVHTARGILMHHVHLTSGKVENYQIVAPTEWNLHPRGALSAGLLGMDAADEAMLMQNTRMLMLSLDPCVGFEIGMHHA